VLQGLLGLARIRNPADVLALAEQIGAVDFVVALAVEGTDECPRLVVLILLEAFKRIVVLLGLRCRDGCRLGFPLLLALYLPRPNGGLLLLLLLLFRGGYLDRLLLLDRDG